MGEQWNLTESNVEELKEKLEELKKVNPDLGYRFHPQKEDSDKERNYLLEIIDKLDAIDMKLNYIFGDHFLVDGKWNIIKLGEIK